MFGISRYSEVSQDRDNHPYHESEHSAHNHEVADCHENRDPLRGLDVVQKLLVRVKVVVEVHVILRVYPAAGAAEHPCTTAPAVPGTAGLMSIDFRAPSERDAGADDLLPLCHEFHD
jgi:hypothetical protein